ncbi:zinc finger Y-chromosomal protein-like isoform X2 [Armigeres subalbatus]|uniref:zinc finger Y-chromosomal protein-like isoform X2 n=1 Tax=Armigeres subalbatus TaxID=124917 RepID=UPI002ED29486
MPDFPQKVVATLVPTRYLHRSDGQDSIVEQISSESESSATDIEQADTAKQRIVQSEAKMDSADEMEPFVVEPDEEPTEDVTETFEEEHLDEEMSNIDAEQPDKVPDAAVLETVSGLEAEKESAEATEREEHTELEVRTEHTEEVNSEHNQQNTVEEHLDDADSTVCEEMFEEIEQNDAIDVDDELIGIDREDSGDMFLGNFCGEVEIKEEEVEIEPEDDQNLLDDDPIMEMPAPIKDEELEDNVVGPTAEIGENASRKKKKGRSSSETDTADEGEEREANRIGEHAYHAPPSVVKQQPKKQIVKKKLRPIASLPNIAQNVRNFLHTKNSTHTCLECHGQFFSIVEYLKHRKRHPKVGNLPYQCRYCPSRFRLYRDMLPHLLTHSKLEKFSCPMCPAQVYSAHKLVSHLQVHRTSPKENYYFKCVTCSVRFSKCKQLEEHNLISHPKFVNGVQVQPTNRANIEQRNATRTVHVCFHCGKVEGTWPELLIHMRVHKGPLACTICLVSLKTSDAFAEHVVKVHKDMGELSYHQCRNPACPREFISLKDLKKHETTCLPMGGEYRCEICDQLYREVDHFVTHMELHSMLSNELGHKMCSHCIFPTTDPASYAAHLVNHHGYRDRVETLEAIYADQLRQGEGDENSEELSDEDDVDTDYDVEIPSTAERERMDHHIADDLILECE